MARDNRSNSTRPFYRVKVINGVCSATTTTKTITNESSDEIENSHLLNVLNWSEVDDLPFNKCAIASKSTIKSDTDVKPKAFYNTVTLSIELQRKMLNLKSMFVDPSARLVNYSQLRTSSIYNDLCEMTKHLTTICLENVTENERKTFFINLYNFLTIHGIGSLDSLPKSVLDLNQFWKTTSYKIGPHIYSLDDIEHGILRGNKPHSYCTQRHFTFNDPRAKYSMRRCDPRIHFALNRGARSSPQIAVYSSSNIEKALNMAAASYCNSEVEVKPDTCQVHLSKLFLWYRNDFGRTELDVLRWITKYLDEPKQSLLKSLLDRPDTRDNLSVTYTIYDWMLNHHNS